MATKTRHAASYWPADTSQPVIEATVTDLLRQAAATVPDRVALVEMNPDEAARPSWTYAQLEQTAEQVARALLRHFQPGERVAIWAPNCARWVLLQQGLSMAGLVLVTVNPAYREEELEYVLRQSRSAGVFFAGEYRGVDMAATVARLRDRLPELRETVCLDDWDAFLGTGDAAISLPEISPDDPVQIQYTSGTTGFPKGALLHHRGIVNASAFVAVRSGVEDGGVWVNPMPMFHIGGGGLTEIGTMNQRGTYVLLPFFEPGLVLEAIEAYRGTIVLAVPTMLIAMLDHPDASTRDTSSLQTVMSGATAVPAPLVRRAKEAFGCRFTIVFGQTELHGVISQTQLQDGPDQQAETVGQPLPQVEVKVADPATGEVLPLGVQGEICARGYQTMHGYFELPDESARTLKEDGWLHMGDLGTMDEDGYLRITGRLKDMIIRGGENIYPREIEERLFEHPGVRLAAVLGMGDETWGEQVVAVICATDPAQPPDAAELRAYCRERLAKYKTPVGWCFVDELPSTALGQGAEVRPARAARQRRARADHPHVRRGSRTVRRRALMATVLEGVRVLELAGIGPGPHAAMLLADMGADVVRVERPSAAAAFPPLERDSVLRNRRSVAADLKDAGQRDDVLRLVDRADVLLEGYRPGVAERLGLGPDTCLERNPRLIYGRMTGWGQDGPLAQVAGHDINYLSMTGALAMIGRNGSKPLAPLNLVGDLGGGSLFLVVGVLAALYERERSGQGQVIDAAMVDGVSALMAMYWTLAENGLWASARGTNMTDGGAPFYDTYACSDGRYMAVGAVEPQFYAALLRGLGLEPDDMPAQMDRSSWQAVTERFTAHLRHQDPRRVDSGVRRRGRVRHPGARARRGPRARAHPRAPDDPGSPRPASAHARAALLPFRRTGHHAAARARDRQRRRLRRLGRLATARPGLPRRGRVELHRVALEALVVLVPGGLLLRCRAALADEVQVAGLGVADRVPGNLCRRPTGARSVRTCALRAR